MTEMISVMDYVKAGEIIKAIKLHRELTGMSLSESKQYVDSLRFRHEMKVLKCQSIDEMRDKIRRVRIFNDDQHEFLLDLIDESFYLGEDSGHATGYMKALEENDTTRRDDWNDDNEDAYNEGYENGREEGYSDGQQRGYEEGHRDGYNECKEEGYDDGYNDGCFVREEDEEEENN